MINIPEDVQEIINKKTDDDEDEGSWFSKAMETFGGFLGSDTGSKLGGLGLAALGAGKTIEGFKNRKTEREFVKEYAKKRGLDEDFLKRNPQGDIAGEGKYDIIADFKAAKLKDIENAWVNTPKYEEGFKGTKQYYDQLAKSSKIKKDLNSMYDDTFSKKGAQGATQDRLSQNTLSFVKNLMPQAQFKIEKNNDGSQSLMILEGYKDPNTNEDSVRYRKVQNIINTDGSLNKLQFENIEGLLKINNVI